MIHLPPQKHEYNPQKLPTRMDFLKATKDLPLPRATKVKVQAYASRLKKSQLKELIRDLEEIMYTTIKEARIDYGKGQIVVPENIWEKERRELIQKAILTKAIINFLNTYLASLEMQRKI